MRATPRYLCTIVEDGSGGRSWKGRTSKRKGSSMKPAWPGIIRALEGAPALFEVALRAYQNRRAGAACAAILAAAFKPCSGTHPICSSPTSPPPPPPTPFTLLATRQAAIRTDQRAASVLPAESGHLLSTRHGHLSTWALTRLIASHARTRASVAVPGFACTPEQQQRRLSACFGALTSTLLRAHQTGDVLLTGAHVHRRCSQCLSARPACAPPAVRAAGVAG